MVNSVKAHGYSNNRLVVSKANNVHVWTLGNIIGYSYYTSKPRMDLMIFWFYVK